MYTQALSLVGCWHKHAVTKQNYIKAHQTKSYQAYLTTNHAMHTSLISGRPFKHTAHPPKSYQAYQSITYQAHLRSADCSRSVPASSSPTRKASDITLLERRYQGRITTGAWPCFQFPAIPKLFLKADIRVFKIGVRVSNKEFRVDIWHDCCKLRNGVFFLNRLQLQLTDWQQTGNPYYGLRPRVLVLIKILLWF